MKQPSKTRADHGKPRPATHPESGEHDGDASFATTLAKGLSVIEAFGLKSPALGNTELAAKTGLTRPTVARLAHTLAQLGYLQYDETRSKYRLGVRALRLLHPLLANLKVRQVARPLMQELSESVRGIVSLGMIDGTSSVYVETARAGEVGSHVPDIGAAVPLVRTTVGRALVSLLSADERTVLDARIRSETPDLWRSYEQNYRAGIQQCAQQGYCLSYGDWVPTLHAVGAPLFRVRSTGNCFAINCGVPAFRLRAGQLETEIGPRLHALAASIRSIVEEPQAGN